MRNKSFIQNIIFDFGEFADVENKRTIFDLFQTKDRCGIYIIRFLNNDYYIGQSIDITKRFLQHKKNHDDIKEITFKLFPKSKLDEVEQELIAEFEKEDIPLRNITFSSIPKGYSDLDVLIPPKEQKLWLGNYNYGKLDKDRSIDVKMQKKYEKKHKKLSGMPVYKDLIPFLHFYISKCIIKPYITERDFWRISCLPGENSYYNRTLCRINIYMQEVLSVYVKNKKINEITFHLAKSKLQTKSLLKKISTKLGLAGIYEDKHYYKTGGRDQTCIVADSIKTAQSLLNDKVYLSAIKAFNLRLMKKGAGFNKSSHCYNLVSDIYNYE